MVDTNSSPEGIDFLIPSNDDATKSIDLIVGHLCESIKEGLGERKQNKEKLAKEKAEKEAVKLLKNRKNKFDFIKHLKMNITAKDVNELRKKPVPE